MNAQTPVRIRVVIADDCEAVLRHVEALLAADFDVIGKVTRGDLMIAAARDLEPDVVIADITMPGCDGITASREILRSRPGLPIVLLTMHNDEDLLDFALRAGIRGYVHKLGAGEELIPAVRAALAGEIFVSKACFRPRP